MQEMIIKVCGVTTTEDARAAMDAGANALGFNFYERSPRYISAERAAEITRAVTGACLKVGVFVNATEDDVRMITALAGLDVVQAHGTTPTVAGLRTWRAAQATFRPAYDAGVEAYLLDKFTPAFGGSGETFDWSLAQHFPFKAIIAGGLDASNVAEAIRITEPWGVDACSRLEAWPGKKDWRRVEAFVGAALSAFHAKQEVQI